MKLLELGFLNPHKSASANSSLHTPYYMPSFTNGGNGAGADSFSSKDKNENGLKTCRRKLIAYATIGIAAAAAWIYILIQNKKIEELTAQLQKFLNQAK